MVSHMAEHRRMLSAALSPQVRFNSNKYYIFKRQRRYVCSGERDMNPSVNAVRELVWCRDGERCMNGFSVGELQQIINWVSAIR